MTTQHKISNEYQRGEAILDIDKLDLEKPWVMTIRPYSKTRSLDQNAIGHVWYQQVAATLREDTAMGVKSECKLTLGIPILRGEDDEFRAAYDRTLKALSYEQKLEVMQWFPVTSLMTTAQKSMYLEQVQQKYAGRVDLKFPGESPSL